VTGQPPSTWEATAASVRGSSHDAAQTPNQDAVRWASVPTPSGSAGWLAAVADGHGGARYVRSDRGAQFAVDAAVEHLAGVLSADAGAAVEPEALLRSEIAAVVERWRRAVDDDHRNRPFTAEETAAAGGTRLDAAPRIAYGATLLVGLVSEAAIGVAQIGDGDSLVRAHGFATRPVPADQRLVAGETTSLCLDTAIDDFRFASVPDAAAPDVVVLATDGYANSFADADWWHSVVDDMAQFLSAEGFAEFAARFPDWLAESALIGGDDVTAAVLVRQPLLVAPTPARVAPTPAQVAPTPEPVADPKPQRPPLAGAVAVAAPTQGDRNPPAPRQRPAPASDSATLLLAAETIRPPVPVGDRAIGYPPPATPPPATPPPGTPPPVTPLVRPAHAIPPTRRNRKKWCVLAAIGAAVGALTAALVLALSGSSGHESPTTPGPAGSTGSARTSHTTSTSASSGPPTTHPVTTSPRRTSPTTSASSKRPPPSGGNPGP
jgi:hypothetical protein